MAIGLHVSNRWRGWWRRRRRLIDRWWRWSGRYRRWSGRYGRWRHPASTRRRHGAYLLNAVRCRVCILGVPLHGLCGHASSGTSKNHGSSSNYCVEGEGRFHGELLGVKKGLSISSEGVLRVVVAPGNSQTIAVRGVACGRVVTQGVVGQNGVGGAIVADSEVRHIRGRGR